MQARAAKSAIIDRDSVWAAKRKALNLVYRIPRSAGRELAFEAFKDRESTALDDFATWCALAEKYGGDWRRWPKGLQHPANPEVAEFAQRHERDVDFHRWMQWQLDDQLAHAAVPGAAGRHEPGRHARPGRRCSPLRRRRLVAAGGAGARGYRRCPTG